MEIETTIININGSRYLRLPPNMLKHLEANEQDTIIVQDEKGNKGKYFSAWKKEVSK